MSAALRGPARERRAWRRPVAALPRGLRRALPVLLAVAAWAAGQPSPSPHLAPFAPPRVDAAVSVSQERLWAEVVGLFERAYWDPNHVDWTAWGERHRDAVVGAPDRAALDAALARMVRELGDDHSSWLGRPADGAGPPVGAPAAPRLGVQLAYVAGRGLVIERVYAGTPAEAAGLRRADVLTAVGRIDLRTIGSLFEANAALAAALTEGVAALAVERGRQTFTVEVAGTAVPFRDVAWRPYALLLGAGVGYLHVPSFQETGVGAAVHAAVGALVEQGATAMVLDLRGNLGGRLVEAGLAIGPFLEGPWARAVARGRVDWLATYGVERDRGGEVGVARLEGDAGPVGEARVRTPVRFAGPVVVLVGSETASAGEIVAGALAAAGRARVIGERTAGNVEAVRAYRLRDGSQVLVAIARVEAADGTAWDGGVEPEVTSRATVSDLARGQDPPLAEALRSLGGLPFVPGRWF